MKKCSICNKNIAVIFASKMENGKSEMQGICMECAKKMGLPIVDQLMKQTGMTEEEIASLSQQMNDVFDEMDLENMEDDNFLNSLLKGPFGAMKNNDEDDIDVEEEEVSEKEETSEDEKPKRKKKKNKKRKHLNTYGTNLTDKARNKEVDKIIG